MAQYLRDNCFQFKKGGEFRCFFLEEEAASWGGGGGLGNISKGGSSENESVKIERGRRNPQRNYDSAFLLPAK